MNWIDVTSAPGTTRRVHYRLISELHTSNYHGDWTTTRTVETDPGGAELVSSEVVGSDKHAPALDIDVPAFLVPSSTPGHSHLYIDLEMPWWRYRIMLWALKVAGVIEPGYYRASVQRKGTHLRKPGVKKPL
jgi:hypothetical protein